MKQIEFLKAWDLKWSLRRFIAIGLLTFLFGNGTICAATDDENFDNGVTKTITYHNGITFYTISFTEIDSIYYMFNEDMTASVRPRSFTVQRDKSGCEMSTIYPENSYNGDVVIPNKVVYKGKTYVVSSIGLGAFRNCSKLRALTIPSSIKYIHFNQFQRDGHSTLEELHINDFAAWCSIEFTHVSETIDHVSPEYEFPDNYIHPLEIAESVFVGNDILLIDKIRIPKETKEIGQYNFLLCHNIKEVVIPEGVETICDFCFMDCYNLEKVTLGKSLSSIGDRSFMRCTNIKTIVSFIENPVGITEYTYDNSVYSNATLYVPRGTKDRYLSCSGWSNFINIQEFDPAAIKKIIEDKEQGFKNSSTYDLQGRRVSSPKQGEIYIQGGRKVKR